MRRSSSAAAATISTLALIAAIVHVLGRLYFGLSGFGVPVIAAVLAAVAFRWSAFDGASTGRSWPIALAVLSLVGTIGSLPYEPQ